MTMTFEDIRDGIKTGDHKMFAVPSAMELSESIRKDMAVEGYVFAYAGSDGNGSHAGRAHLEVDDTTITRRQTPIGAAPTVAAAALPAVEIGRQIAIQRSSHIAMAVFTFGDDPPSKMATIWKDYKRRLMFEWHDGNWDLVGNQHPDGYSWDYYAGPPAETFQFCGRAFEPVLLTEADLDEMAKAEVVTDPYELEDIP
jgi:hypothetical protein